MYQTDCSTKVRFIVSMIPRFVITGPDGAGKSTTARAVALQLGRDYRVVQPGPSRPVYAVVDREMKYPFQTMMKFIHWLHRVADETRKPALVGAVNVLNVLFCTRVVSPFFIRRFKPDVILAARDAWVDPSVYSSIYVPLFAKQSLERRIQQMKWITGVPSSHIIFFLTVSPEEAIRRINARIHAEKTNPEMIARTRSSRWRHIHEDPETLHYLQNEFFNAFRILQQRYPVQVREINSSAMPQSQVVDSIAGTIRGYLDWILPANGN